MCLTSNVHSCLFTTSVAAVGDSMDKSLNRDQANVRCSSVREEAVNPSDIGASGMMVTPSE